jgi:hypothetical protein
MIFIVLVSGLSFYLQYYHKNKFKEQQKAKFAVIETIKKIKL